MISFLKITYQLSVLIFSVWLNWLIFETQINTILILNIQMLKFLSNQEFLAKNLVCCHNYSIKTPENMDEVQKISVSI